MLWKGEVPAAVVVEAADGLDGVGVAEVRRFEEVLVALFDRGGEDLFGKGAFLTEVGSDTEDEESFGIIVAQALLVIEEDGIPVVKEGLADPNGCVLIGKGLLDGICLAGEVAGTDDQRRKQRYRYTQKQTTRTEMRTA